MDQKKGVTVILVLAWVPILVQKYVSLLGYTGYHHGNYLGKEILFQIDHTTFICRQRTNKLKDIVSLLVEQN